MGRWWRIRLFVLIPFLSSGQQNLVPNWSFENITNCNFNTNGDLEKATPWFAAIIQSSTDLYNVCDTNYYHVPNNFLGSQNPKSGNGYIGLIPFIYPSSSSTYREYAEVKLIDSLQANKTYCISFYVNSATNSGFASCFISNIGAVFSKDTLKPVTDSLIIEVIPDIISQSIISDTLNWSKISGVYNCTNTKNFITIGNFSNNNNTNFICEFQNGSYYYFDDVSVVEISPAAAGNDTAMCAGNTAIIGGLPTFEAAYTWYELSDSANSTSIDSIHIAKPHVSPTQTTTYVMQKQQCNVITTDTVTVVVNCVGIKQIETPQLTVFPNPANQNLSIQYKGRDAVLNITDLLGKEIRTVAITSGKTEIDLSELNDGVYFISVFDQNKISTTKKIVVQH